MNCKAAKIAHYLSLGKTQFEISHLCNCSYSTISKVKNAIEKNLSLPLISDSRFKTTITPEISIFIEEETIKFPNESDEQVAHKIFDKFRITISRSTVNRFRHNSRFAYKKPRVCQDLSEEQKKERVKFAYSMLKSGIDMQKIIFSDESRFEFQDDSGRLWRRYGENNIQTTSFKKKFAQGIMVYAAIGKDYKSNLVIIEDSVDTIQYWINVESSGMLEKDPSSYIFMQDGATPHTSIKTKEYFSTRCRILQHWPANSPDLNPIEHLWAMMKQIIKTRIRGLPENHKFTVDEFKHLIQEAYDSITIDVINNLINSFENRLYLVIKHDGESINSYLHQHVNRVTLDLNGLSNEILNELYSASSLIAECDTSQPHKRSVPQLHPLNMPQNEDFPNIRRHWSKEEDKFLTKTVSQIGTKWKLISNLLSGRSWVSCRNRYFKIVHKSRISMTLMDNDELPFFM